jgi:hypothetical protein
VRASRVSLPCGPMTATMPSFLAAAKICSHDCEDCAIAAPEISNQKNAARELTAETQVVRKNRNLEVGIGPVGRRVFHSEKTTTLSGCFDLDFLCSSSAAQIT